MKVTVALLSDRKNLTGNIFNSLKNLINTIISNTAFLLILFGIVLITTIIFNVISIPKGILNLATNFRQANNFEFGIKEIASINNIFNINNYLIKKDEIKKEEVVDTIPKDKKEKLERIDSLAEGITEVEVFANKNINMEVTQNTQELQRISLEDIRILNYSDKRQINYKELLQGVVTLTKSSDAILIYNTHTSESYAQSEGYQFEYSGTRRSRDAKYNMLTVANEFKNNLLEKGFNVTHNTTPHDYGTYDSSYSRSRITVQDALKKDTSIGLSIDLHRDAIENLNFRPSVNINGVDVAQCMFVIGVGYDEDSNPYYEDNLKLALKLQYIADKIYPGLFRPMIIRNSVYNQDLKRYSILIEVGASGNTFDDAFFATRCLTNLLNIMYKD